jgi:hypothetical protein
VTRRLPLLIAALAIGAIVYAVSTRPAEQTQDGVVIGVDSRGLADVRGFTLRTDDARTIIFRIDTLDNSTEFPPGHLIEHQATSQRVRVWYRADGDALVAFRIEDAPQP